MLRHCQYQKLSQQPIKLALDTLGITCDWFSRQITEQSCTQNLKHQPDTSALCVQLLKNLLILLELVKIALRSKEAYSKPQAFTCYIRGAVL